MNEIMTILSNPTGHRSSWLIGQLNLESISKIFSPSTFMVGQEIHPVCLKIRHARKTALGKGKHRRELIAMEILLEMRS